ncbi:MFS transporter [Sphingosinithalassobacter portus]|uniref:MFS transporter n=1 Tax=Stakelama portus TaxID=2676234 RepID=UPI00137B6BE3|nr:MFS transporter [Sphingosinithalassobacter portus]
MRTPPMAGDGKAGQSDVQGFRRGIAPHWWALAVLFLYYSFTYVDRSLASVLVPEIKRTIHLSDTAVGMILGAIPTAAFAIASLPAGLAADRWPRKWIIGAGVALFSVATVLLGLSDGAWEIMAARALGAVGEAAILPAAYSFLADSFPRKRVGTAIAFFSMGAKAGVATSLALAGAVLIFAQDIVARGHGFGLFAWQIEFLIFAGPMLLCLLLILTLKEPPRQRMAVFGEQKGSELVAYLKSQRRLLLLLMGGFAAVCFCGFSLGNWIPAYLSRRFAMQPQEYGPILALLSVVSGLTLMVKGMLIDWLYIRGVKDAYVRLYTWLLAGSLPIVWTMFLIDNKWLFLVMLGLVQVVTIPFISYASTTFQVIAPGNIRARITSAALIIFAIAGGLGTSSVGAMNDLLFGGDAGLGVSLGFAVSVMMPTALILLRLALKPLHAAVAQAERLNEAAPRETAQPMGGTKADA